MLVFEIVIAALSLLLAAAMAQVVTRSLHDGKHGTRPGTLHHASLPETHRMPAKFSGQLLVPPAADIDGYAMNDEERSALRELEEFLTADSPDLASSLQRMSPHPAPEPRPLNRWDE